MKVYCKLKTIETAERPPCLRLQGRLVQRVAPLYKKLFVLYLLHVNEQHIKTINAVILIDRVCQRKDLQNTSDNLLLNDRYNSDRMSVATTNLRVEDAFNDQINEVLGEHFYHFNLENPSLLVLAIIKT